MHEIAKRDYPVSRTVMPRDEAIGFFRGMGEEYKAKIIEDIPAGEHISLYRQGEFIDLCRGPHVPTTGKLKAFKLMKVAGAYWRGDSRNEMLARIYGTAWTSKEALDAYLHQIEEAEKRDHRKIGRALNLFHMQEEAPGMVFWHERGWRLYQLIVQYMGDLWREHGYREIRTPQLVDRSLWEKYGHWEKLHSDMFITESAKRLYAVKPMNCPCHIQVYNQGLKSYRDLPLRLAEFGSCHRNEQSGALHGLMRVRGFTQDDAHIFCSEDQIQPEVSNFIVMLNEVYRDFGFNEVLVKLSTRPDKRVGSDETWDKAEAGLASALQQNGLAYEVQPGEGAFYGPKVEFTLKDSIGRLWQCGTVQLDFNLPVRLGAEFVDEDNSRKPPVMLHRAILGSMERFIGILIEHHAGAFPLWLGPVQAGGMKISQAQEEYVTQVAQQMRAAGLRIQLDLRNEKITYKIREHSLQKLPYQLIIGDKEVAGSLVAVRTRSGEDLGQMTLEALLQRLQTEIRNG